MNPIKVKLTSGEVLLMETDVIYLKNIIDAAFSSLYETTYMEIKGQKPEETRSALAKLTDDELINIAKCDDLNPMEGQVHRSFTLKIRAELFKRKGLGYKNVHKMSFSQRSYLEELGLSTE
ncbi:hypothetical protein [Chryseobacterium arthrosphaerae]|uniref:hypothetical protein n=1 Tax=Chryseobacterium arthrosphaerae TaxID=651561 RepID=UPI00241DB157|nr:hypothetical protein [Chryseobacterium arthrosphaerae]